MAGYNRVNYGYTSGSSALDYGNALPNREPVRRTRKVVKTKTYGSEKLLAISLILAIFALAVAYISTQSILISKGATINSIKSEMATVQKENDNLSVKVSALKAPSRVENVAKYSLGMVKSANANVVYYVPNENKSNVATDSVENANDLKAIN